MNALPDLRNNCTKSSFTFDSPGAALKKEFMGSRSKSSARSVYSCKIFLRYILTELKVRCIGGMRTNVGDCSNFEYD